MNNSKRNNCIKFRNCCGLLVNNLYLYIKIFDFQYSSLLEKIKFSKYALSVFKEVYYENSSNLC